jgi:hypothetical protein
MTSAELKQIVIRTMVRCKVTDMAAALYVESAGLVTAAKTAAHYIFLDKLEDGAIPEVKEDIEIIRHQCKHLMNVGVFDFE